MRGPVLRVIFRIFFFMFFHRKIFNAQENQTFSWIKVTFSFFEDFYDTLRSLLNYHLMNWEVSKEYLTSFSILRFCSKSLKVSIQQARFYQWQKMIVSLTDKLNNRKRKGETCQIRAKGDKLSIARFYLETRGGKSESWQPLSSPLRMLELALQLVGSLYTMGTEVFLKSHLPWAFLLGSADNAMTSCLKVMCLISESSLSLFHEQYFLIIFMYDF